MPELETRNAQPETFVWPVRVYYEDTDSGGVVYYANYLKFMERARTEWLRALGFEQTSLLDEHHVIFVVREVGIEYLRPARFNDLLDVTVSLAEAGRSQIVLKQTVENSDVFTRATVKVVCVDGKSFKPVRIPAIIKEKIQGKS
jgi:acyl-CoA thioester hydrolase